LPNLTQAGQGLAGLCEIWFVQERVIDCDQELRINPD